MPKTTGITAIDDYVAAVRSGKIPACKYVKQAINRHQRDLKNHKLQFKADKAEDFFYFAEHCTHYEGKWANKPVVLEPWQKFVFGSLFAWYYTDGRRRYREAVIEIPKKNGKSFIGAIIALYMMMFDEEPGAQVYGAATNRSHALRLSFRAATEMVKMNPHLADLCKIKLGNGNERIEFESSFFEPITAKPQNLDGFNVHCGLFDETKDHDTALVYDVIKNGIAARDKPMVISITTAGSNQESLGYTLREYAIKVLEESIQDESLFAIIYTIDEGDLERWDKPDVWEKANPNFGISVNPEYFEQQVTRAASSPLKKNDFLTKHLNVWIRAAAQWFDMDIWKQTAKQAAPEWAELKGQPAHIAVDLASVQDMTSVYVMTRDKADNRYHIIGKNFLPEGRLMEAPTQYQHLYRVWEEQGYLVATEGKYTDYSVVYEYILQMCKTFQIGKIGFDRTRAAELMDKLDRAGFDVVSIGQTANNMSQPMRDIELYAGKQLLEHYGDPALSWAMSNVTAKEDRYRRLYPTRDNTKKKIDPAIVLIMLFALNRELPLPARAGRKRRRRVV